MKKVLIYILTIVLTAFALLTLFLSSSVIFDWFGIRAKEGNYVLFIVWANFISSIFYLVAVYGLIKFKKWSYQLLGGSVFILVIALIGLLFHIYSGGLYETKTVGAMIFRISLTTIFTLFTYLIILKNKTHEN
jgi:hypothetical protein